VFTTNIGWHWLVTTSGSPLVGELTYIIVWHFVTTRLWGCHLQIVSLISVLDMTTLAVVRWVVMLNGENYGTV